METVWRDLGKEICEALGLDITEVVSVKINIILDDVATIEITRKMFVNEFDNLKKIVKEKYKVIPTFDPSLPNLQQLHKCDDIAYRPWRQRLGLSLRQVAKATGVSPATISRMEHGKECLLSNVMKVHEYYAKNKK